MSKTLLSLAFVLLVTLNAQAGPKPCGTRSSDVLKAITSTHDERMISNQVRLDKKAEKIIQKLPSEIQANFKKWMQRIETDGLAQTRMIPGYHDEPYQSIASGRKARLNERYRVIYIVQAEENKKVVRVLSFSDHGKDY